MAPDIRHIVFDVGRVLIHYDPHIPFRRLIPDDAERAWFFEEVCTPAWNLEQDRGRSWAEAEAEAIARHPAYAAQIRAFRPAWHDMVSHAYADSVAILERLIAAGHDVTLLSNFAADTFAEAAARFPFLGATRGATVSGRIGIVKPDAAIYAHHARAFALDGAATLFIDDAAANVEAARACGWHAVRFFDAATLRADLARFGIAA